MHRKLTSAFDSVQKTVSANQYFHLQGSGFHPLLSVTAATLFTIANAFPVIAAWIPPSAQFKDRMSISFPWYTVPTVSWCILALGLLWWLVFRLIVPHVGWHQGHTLKVRRKLYFHEEHGYPVQWHEKLNFKWVTGGEGWADDEQEVRMRSQSTL